MRARNGRSVVKLVLAAGVAGAVLAPGTSGTALAQGAQGAQADRQVRVDIRGGKLSDALIALGRQSKAQIAFLPASVAGRRATGIRGTFTVEEALERMLANTGLSFREVRPGSYYVSGPSLADLEKARGIVSDIGADQGFVNGQANVPEILVRGLRRWSLNTDLPRSENEAQPYTVFSREQIKRSGALNLEDFFRDNLGSNVSVQTARQGAGVTGRDSQINLRGLGLDSTLILVDGRRFAEPNSGATGAFTQSSVMGIPLEQIERVEVLASSAAGQYGSNAVGGVINIILRRDYQGIEVSAYLGGSTRGDAIERRLSANATFPVFAGTSLTLSGSWRKSDPLYSEDRDFINERLAFILRNKPDYLETASLIYSTTPNIRSVSGGNLVLKPQFAVNGITALGSNRTFVPAGFQGIGTGGAGALLANAGRQNLEPGPNNSDGPVFGDRVRLLTGGTTWNASATVRSELAKWLSIYGSLSYSKVESSYDVSVVPDTVTLRANSPVNPFQQDIRVSFPSPGHIDTRMSESETVQLIGGAIVRLPWSWQANFDVNASWGNARSDTGQQQLSPDYYARLITNGTIDVLRDTIAYPIAFEFDTEGRYSRRSPSRSNFTSYTLKLAGPLSFARLWGGKPVATLVGELQRQWFGESRGINDGPAEATINFSPARSQRTRSVYGEVVFPIVGADNHVPLIHGFELRLSGRYDAYTGRGTNTTFACVPTRPGTLTPEELSGPCPPAGVTIPYRTVRNDTWNPVVAAKWSITPDIALRGSYSTGYTPPYLSQLVEVPGFAGFGFASGVSVAATDPQRGNERIGTPLFGGLLNLVEGVTGGNADIDPQRSTSWSFGAILTPRFVDGLTLRADWTRITIANAYFSPGALLAARTPQEQAQFNDFLAAYPDRFVRAAPAAGDPFPVGRISFIDATMANLTRYRSESLDFSGEYLLPVGKGQLQINGSATLLLHLTTQLTPSAPVQKLDGIVSAVNIFGVGDSLRFRGNLSAVYSRPGWNAGVRVQHFSGYYLVPTRTVVDVQGSARVPGQTLFDLFGTVKLFARTELSAGIKNLFDVRPPIDTTRGTGYAPYGDPRLRSFFVNLSQRF